MEKETPDISQYTLAAPVLIEQAGRFLLVKETIKKSRNTRFFPDGRAMPDEPIGRAVER